jgi:DnaA family protein
MRQLTFELKAPPKPTFDNFITGRNQELLGSLMAMLRGEGSERFMYVWGESGAGKTHLAQSFLSFCEKHKKVCLNFDQLDSVTDLRGDEYVFAENIDGLLAETQVKFFNVYNTIREGSGLVVAFGSVPVHALSLRADVVTRLGWGLVYQVKPLEEVDKIRAMQDFAHGKGFSLAREVISYVLSHYRRDLFSLLSLLEGLDRYSLEVKRKVTVPLVREFLDLLDERTE